MTAYDHSDATDHAELDKHIYDHELMTHLDETTRLIVATVVDSDLPMMPLFTLGQVVGALTAPEAIQFSSLVDAFVAGELQASVREDGSMRLIPAA